MDHRAVTEEVARLWRYGKVTALSYVFLLALLYVLTDEVGVPADLGYPIALTVTYFLLFFVSSTHAFGVRPTKPAFARFWVAVALFWCLNNASFLVLYGVFGFGHFSAALANMLVFGPGRYLFYKLWVFRVSSSG